MKTYHELIPDRIYTGGSQDVQTIVKASTAKIIRSNIIKGTFAG